NAAAIAPCFPTSRPGLPMPAQLTAASMRPSCRAARSTAPSTADSSVTSVAMKAARSPRDAAAADPCASFTSRSTTRPPACTILCATASPSPDAPPLTTACASFSCMSEAPARRPCPSRWCPRRPYPRCRCPCRRCPFGRSFQADGRIDPGGHAAVVEPARRDGLGLGIELHHLFAVGAEIAEFGAARSREAENRHGHRNRHVDSHLAHVDLVLEFAGGGTALRENAGTVAEGIVVDERDRFVQGVHADDAHHRP